MSHELTISPTGKAEMAYVGATPWHGLGQTLDENATLDEWRVAAGMDWSINASVVQYSVPRMIDGEPTVETLTCKDRVVLYRSDTTAPLAVVSNRYQVVQPVEALEFFRDMIEAGGYTMETAGTLFGGKRLWALARSGRGFDLPGGDAVNDYILLATGCDGGLATSVRDTAIRVVCNNTLTTALDTKAKYVTVRHSTRFNPDAVKQKLREVSASFDAFARAAEALARVQVNARDASSLLARILPEPADRPVEETRGFKRIMELFGGRGIGATLPSAEGTAWGLLNAVTQDVDHSTTARTADNRLNSAWFGAGDELKSRALHVLTSLV